MNKKFSVALIKITVPLKNIEAMEADTVTFKCEISKKDRSEGKWTFNGQEITNTEKYTISTAGCVQTLKIADVTMDDKNAMVKYAIEEVFTEATLLLNGEGTLGDRDKSLPYFQFIVEKSDNYIK